MSQDSEHAPPSVATPVLDYAPPTLSPRWRRTIRALLYIDMAVSIIATIICVLEVETIVATGPALLIIGFLLIAFGSRARQMRSVVAGAELIGAVLLVFALINLLDWGPRKAQTPVSWIACVQVLVAWTLASHALLRTKEGVPIAFEL